MCGNCGCNHTHHHETESTHHEHELHHHDDDFIEHERFHKFCVEVPEGAESRGRSSTGSKIVKLEHDILSKNQAFAERNRRELSEKKTLALNLISSPGAGKTTLLCKTLEMLKGQKNLAVIEGDLQTSLDAERIQALGVPAIQINTGKGCHLDAHMVEHALIDLNIAPEGILFIENVGNLVCPTDFDLGEHAKVVLLSVTEGEDKPLKYPNIFMRAEILLLTKIDLSPYVGFNLELCVANAKKINPQLKIICISAKTGEGMKEWLGWLEQKYNSLIAKT